MDEAGQKSQNQPGHEGPGHEGPAFIAGLGLPDVIRDAADETHPIGIRMRQSQSIERHMESCRQALDYVLDLGEEALVFIEGLGQGDGTRDV
jgi:hypothetical protein